MLCPSARSPRKADGECLVCDRDTRIVVDENDNVSAVN